MLFKLKGTKGVVGVLLDSPMYLDIPLKERKLIVTEFMEQFTMTSDEINNKNKLKKEKVHVVKS